MSKLFNPPVSIAIALFLPVISLQAQDFSWDSGGRNSKYETVENWNTNTVPFRTGTDMLSLSFDDGGTVTFDSNTGTRNVDSLSMGNGSVLNISGGVFDHGKAGNSVRTYVGSSGMGATVNQSGGKLSIGHILRIGHRNASGVYNLSGGELVIFRGGSSFLGSVGGSSISLGSGEFAVSGGSLVTRSGVEIDSNAVFRVLGAGASLIGIGTTKAIDPGAWFQKGTLSCGIGPQGVTPIRIAGGSNHDPFVTFLEGSELDLIFYETKPHAGTWTLLELEGADITDHGLALSAATQANPNWSFEIDNTGPVGRLNASYVDVPESSGYALILGMAGSLILARRRRS